MAYGKRYGKRGRAATKKKILYKRPTANNQKYQILDLTKRVNRNTRRLRDLTYPVYDHFQVLNNELSANFNFYSLYDFSAWQPVWQQTPVGSLEPRIGKFQATRMDLDFDIQAGKERDPITWTMLIVTPKSQKVCEEVEDASGNLSFITQGRDYVDVGGKTFMNKQRWHIHAYRKGITRPLTTSIPSTLVPTQTIVNDMKPVRGHIKLLKPLNINSRTDTWRNVNMKSFNHNHRYTMYVFNDNASTLEGSPKFSLNGLVKGIQSQPYQV